MRCGVEKINHSCAFSSSVSKPCPPKKNKPRPISARSKYRETTFGAPKRSRESHCFTTLRRILLFFFYPFLVAFNVVGRPRNKSPDKVLATETPSINVTSPRGELPRINDCVFEVRLHVSCPPYKSSVTTETTPYSELPWNVNRRLPTNQNQDFNSTVVFPNPSEGILYEARL